MLRLLITVFFTFSFIGCINAQGLKRCDLHEICADAGSNIELKECYAKLLEAEDTRLNREYQKLIKKIRDQGYGNPNLILSKLRSSQRKWNEYRDMYCSFRLATAEGGTIGGLYVLDCRCTLTRDKSDHLTDDLVNLFSK